MRPKKPKKPYLCECGCGKLIQPHRIDNRGNWSKKRFFSDECRLKARAKMERPKHNVHHVAHNEKDRKWIHPLCDKFIYGRLA